MPDQPLPCLEDMDIADLHNMRDLLTSILDAGLKLSGSGLSPRFDLTPGMTPTIILTAARMPFAYHADLPYPSATDPALLSAGASAPPSPVPPPPTPADVAMPAPPAGPQAPAGGDVAPEPEPHSARPEQTEAAPEGAAPVAEADSGGGVAAAPAAPNPPPWTEAEEEALIGHAVRLILGGMGKKAAHMEAGRLIGRPGEGASFRLYTKLRDRFDAALQAAERRAAEPVPTAAPEPKPAAAPAPAAPAPLTPYGELCAHLDRIAEGPHDFATCAEVLRLAIAGLAIDDIGAELGLKGPQVKAMFDVLTGLHKGEDDKWRRRFTREDVLEELEARLASARASAAE